MLNFSSSVGSVEILPVEKVSVPSPLHHPEKTFDAVRNLKSSCFRFCWSGSDQSGSVGSNSRWSHRVNPGSIIPTEKPDSAGSLIDLNEF